MRIKDDSIFSRKERSAEFRRNYFIAFEGFTEYKYFEGLNTHREAVGISNTVDIQLLDRFEHDKSDSDSRSISKKMAEYRRLISEGVYSVGLFTGEILQQLFDRRCDKLKGPAKKTCYREIVKLYPGLRECLETSDHVSEGYVKKHSWNEATELAEEYLNKLFPQEKIILQTPPDRRIETYDADTDVFCLVVDRDRDSRPTNYYRYLLQDCSSEHISLYVSNPCFEFWLMLHFDKSLELSQEDIEDLKSNKKTIHNGKEMRTANRLLLEMFPEYDKANIQFEKVFLGKVGSAIEKCRIL